MNTIATRIGRLFLPEHHFFAILMGFFVVASYHCVEYSLDESQKLAKTAPSSSIPYAVPTPPPLFLNNTTPLHPAIRHNPGPLSHQNSSAGTAGNQISGCNSQKSGYTRTKHRIKSNAASFNWRSNDVDDLDESSWKIENIRNEATRKKAAYVRIDAVRRNALRVDQTVADDHDDSIGGNDDKWGAEDPRVVIWKGSRVVVYHSRSQKQMWLYHDIPGNDTEPVMLTICGHSTERVEKNWMPLVVDEMFLLVYSIDPLVVLRYDVGARDGVCELIYGHLPRRAMESPFGGTPFKEIKFARESAKGRQTQHSKQNGSDNDGDSVGNVVARSFLSFAHTRKVEDDKVSQDRRKRRVYRPVPVVLHVYCPSSADGIKHQNNHGKDKLDECTFGIDIHTPWYEVQSPVEVFRSKFAEKRTRSVSFPYDLHLFPKMGMVRVGVEYEDCFSVYEDYKVDYDRMKEGQWSHPVGLELKKNIMENGSKMVGFLPRFYPPPSSTCPRAYSHPGRRLVTSPLVTNENTELLDRIVDRIWIVSHGGISGEERIRKEIGLREEGARASGEKRRSVVDILAYYPYPLMDAKEPQRGPRLCIYLFGSVYESVLSLLESNPDHSKLMHNDESYPSFSTLSQLLSHPHRDPLGILHQFEQFLTAKVSYPIVMMRADVFRNPKALRVVSEFAGGQYDFSSLDMGPQKSTSSLLNSIADSALRNQLVERYKELNDIFEGQPLVRLRMPGADDGGVGNGDDGET